MAKEKPPQKEQIKVTDKRIFTPEGEIREEFRQQIRPVDPSMTRPQEKPPERPPEKAAPVPQPRGRASQCATDAPKALARGRSDTLLDGAFGPVPVG